MIGNLIIFSMLCYSISGFVIGNVVLDKITNDKSVGSADEEFKMTFGELISSIVGLQ